MPFFVVDWLMGLFGLAKWVPYLCYQRPAARRPSTAARRPSTAAAARRPRQKRPQPANRQPAQPPSASVSYSWTAGGRPSRGTAAVPSWPAGGTVDKTAALPPSAAAAAQRRAAAAEPALMSPAITQKGGQPFPPPASRCGEARGWAGRRASAGTRRQTRPDHQLS